MLRQPLRLIFSVKTKWLINGSYMSLYIETYDI
jgi:hypothetical protein